MSIAYLVTGVLGFCFISAVLLIAYQPILAKSPRLHYLYAGIQWTTGFICGVAHYLNPTEDIWIYALVLFLAGLWEYWVGRRYAAKLGLR